MSQVLVVTLYVKLYILSLFCFRRQPLAELIGLLKVLRELRLAYMGFALFGEHGGIVAAVVVELVGVEGS